MDGAQVRTLTLVSNSLDGDNPSVRVIRYLGCLIIVQGDVVPGEGLRGRYEIVPASSTAARAFGYLGIARIASETIDAAVIQTICEWAKCEVDFLLEEPF